ncbi:MAG: hypothetical protein ACFHW5_15800 [Verrucomicrobiota bacterium]
MPDKRSRDDSSVHGHGSSRSDHQHHHHRHRRKRRRSRNHGGSVKSINNGLLLFAVILAFVVALGFCLWMIIPPLLQYLSQSTHW